MYDNHTMEYILLKLFHLGKLSKMEFLVQGKGIFSKILVSKFKIFNFYLFLVFSEF